MKRTILSFAILLSFWSGVSGQLNWSLMEGIVGTTDSKLLTDDSGIYLFSENVMIFSEDGNSWQKNRTPKMDDVFVDDGMIVGVLNDREDYTFFISENKGKDWRTTSFENPVRSEVRNVQVEGNRVFFQNQHSEMFVSDKSFSGWQLVERRSKGSGVIHSQLRGDTLYYSDFKNVIHWTVLGSDTWQSVAVPIQANQWIKDLLTSATGLVILVTDDEVYFTGDLGQSWHISQAAVEGDLNGPLQYGKVIKLASHRTLFTTEDGGQTWHSSGFDVIDDDIKMAQQAMSGDERVFSISQGFGLTVVDEAAEFQSPETDGINLGRVIGMADTEDKLWVASDMGIQYYDRLNDNWSFAGQLEPFKPYDGIHASRDHYVVAWDEDHMYYSLDDGVTWTKEEIPLERVILRLRSCYIAPSGVYVLLGETVRRFDYLTKTYSSPFNIRDIPSMVSFEGRHYLLENKKSIRFTSDLGTFWYRTPLSFDLADLTATVDELVGVDFSRFSQEGRLWLSKDGKNWTRAGKGLPEASVEIAGPQFFKVQGGTYVNWYDRGIFYSEDDMMTWNKVVDNDCDSAYVYYQEGNDIFRGWFGMEKLSAKTLSTSDHTSSSLSVYPNPTQGWLRLDHEEKIDMINVYKMDGTKIKSIDASPAIYLDVPPGVYLIEALESSGQRVSTKVVLDR